MFDTIQKLEYCANAGIIQVQKGYLDVDTSKVPFIYRLQQHFPE